MANLLGRKWRTAKRFLAQRPFGTMCVALVPTRGQTTHERHFHAAARNTFKGLRGGNSSGRLVLVPSNSLEQLNGALARASPQKAEPRS